MANYNKVLLIGNLTRDPQLRYTPNERAVCEFGMAVNRKWKSQSGQDGEEVLYVEVVAWGRQAETLDKYMKKGRPIFVEGRLTLDQWESKQGEKRSKIRVTLENFQFLGGRQGTGTGGANRPDQQGDQKPDDYQYNQDLEDDTIPF